MLVAADKVLKGDESMRLYKKLLLKGLRTNGLLGVR